MSNRHILREVSLPQIQINHCAFEKVKFWDYPDSRFRHWCFYWNATPGARIICQGKVLELVPETAVLIPPFTSFSTQMEQEFEHFYIHFSSPGLLEQTRREVIPLDGAFAVRKIPGLLQKEGTAQLLALQSLLSDALEQIPENFLPEKQKGIPPAIRKVVELMNRRIGIPTANAELCLLADMGKNEFYKLFKKEMHLSPRQYLLALRMSHASRLLRHSRSSIDEIAAGCGFADRYHFSKAFRKEFGIPPAEYRKKHMKNFVDK
jgi:AraC-like DNA-binding protein